MKKLVLGGSVVLSFLLLAHFVVPQFAVSGEAEKKELAMIKEQFGPVLKLTGTALREINAIANLLIPGSGMMAIDLTHQSREFCMLEPFTGRYMIHFSQTPEETTEDILYFINPETFKEKGLQVKDLPALPVKLGEMRPFQWYYYDGKSFEPHHGRKIGREFLVMAIDVK